MYLVFSTAQSIYKQHRKSLRVLLNDRSKFYSWKIISRHVQVGLYNEFAPNDSCEVVESEYNIKMFRELRALFEIRDS